MISYNEQFSNSSHWHNLLKFDEKLRYDSESQVALSKGYIYWIAGIPVVWTLFTTQFMCSSCPCCNLSFWGWALLIPYRATKEQCQWGWTFTALPSALLMHTWQLTKRSWSAAMKTMTASFSEPASKWTWILTVYPSPSKIMSKKRLCWLEIFINEISLASSRSSCFAPARNVQDGSF